MVAALLGPMMYAVHGEYKRASPLSSQVVHMAWRLEGWGFMSALAGGHLAVVRFH